MEKGKKLARAIKTNKLVNECIHCIGKVQKDEWAIVELKKYRGFEEGSNQFNGEILFIGFCERCGNVYYIPIEKRELDGDYRMVKVN